MADASDASGRDDGYQVNGKSACAARLIEQQVNFPRRVPSSGSMTGPAELRYVAGGRGARQPIGRRCGPFNRHAGGGRNG